MKIVKDLLLALVNATLLLAALCLFLVLMIINRVDGLTETFAQNLSVVAPLRQDIQDTKAELSGLRADLAGLENDLAGSAAVTRVQAGMAGVDTRLETMSASLETLSMAPQKIVDHAIGTLASEIAGIATRVRGCVPPDASS